MLSHRLMLISGFAAGFVGAFLILASTVFGATPQQSRPVCGDRDVILSRLAQAYSETPVALGLRETGQVLEVLASPSGSWTVLLTEPGGPTCLLFVGEAWQKLPKAPTAAKGPSA